MFIKFKNFLYIYLFFFRLLPLPFLTSLLPFPGTFRTHYQFFYFYISRERFPLVVHLKLKLAPFTPFFYIYKRENYRCRSRRNYQNQKLFLTLFKFNFKKIKLKERILRFKKIFPAFFISFFFCCCFSCCCCCSCRASFELFC